VSVVESNLLFAVSALGFSVHYFFLFCCGEAGSASCPLCQNSNSALGARCGQAPKHQTNRHPFSNFSSFTTSAF
jgi:hypothetical protein